MGCLHVVVPDDGKPPAWCTICLPYQRYSHCFSVLHFYVLRTHEQHQCLDDYLQYSGYERVLRPEL
eukprot:6182417-Pleurochrysis_carterae.AAC.3